MPEKFRPFWFSFFLSVRFRSIHERKKIKSKKVTRFAHSPWLAALDPRRIDKKKNEVLQEVGRKAEGKKWEIGFSQCYSGSSCLQGYYLYCCLWSLFYSWRFFGFFFPKFVSFLSSHLNIIHYFYFFLFL